MIIPESMQHVLLTVSPMINQVESDWLVGGSCGLLLQGAPLASQPGDLDIYADKPAAQRIFDCLQLYSVDLLQYSETEIYRSYLSHYRIKDVQIELVGGFHVEVKGTSYQVEVSDLMMKYHAVATLGDVCVRLMPLAHEFIFNVLRNRPDRYRSIAEIMQSNKELHLPPFMEILERNQFSSHHIDNFFELLKIQ